MTHVSEWSNVNLIQVIANLRGETESYSEKSTLHNIYYRQLIFDIISSLKT